MLPPKLKSLARRISDEKLRKKVIELMEITMLKIDGKEQVRLPLATSPAGLSHHHCYPGGYVEHVFSTANIALSMCDSIETVYHGRVNRNLVLAGVLLHDIFKAFLYSRMEDGEYDSTRLADYLDHLSLAASELLRRDFPLELVHIVSSHHGSYGPIRPRTVEALVCHLADVADSRLNGEVLSAAAYITRRIAGHELDQLNSKEAFEIVDMKATEGWQGAKKAYASIKKKRRTQKT